MLGWFFTFELGDIHLKCLDYPQLTCWVVWIIQTTKSRVLCSPNSELSDFYAIKNFNTSTVSYGWNFKYISTGIKVLSESIRLYFLYVEQWYNGFNSKVLSINYCWYARKLRGTWRSKSVATTTTTNDQRQQQQYKSNLLAWTRFINCSAISVYSSIYSL